MSKGTVTVTRPTSNDALRSYYDRREVAELAAEYEAAGYGRRTAEVMAR